MNKNIGDMYESKLVELLSKRGWWCHLFAYKPEGQPCDVVALKDNFGILVDVKHCNEERFSFANIRYNQRTCFQLAINRGNTHCGFAIFFETRQKWRWLPYEDVVRFEGLGRKSVDFEDTDDFSW